MAARIGFPRVFACTNDGLTIRAVGREGETLLMLMARQPRGLRAYDFRGGPPFRLAAYIHDLRGMGLAIHTEREAHATGFHAVYFLQTRLEIIAIDTGNPKSEAAA